jgi:sulfatase modifying factor 1
MKFMLLGRIQLLRQQPRNKTLLSEQMKKRTNNKTTMRRCLAVKNFLLLLLSFLFAAATFTASALPSVMTLIPSGIYHPLIKSSTDASEVPVKAYYLDVVPVSNRDYLEFVRANPRWRRSRVSRLFADESYLINWAGDLELGSNAPANAPVVYVSWFAARAYAQWQGEHLPTVTEWEYAAAASATQANGENDPAFKSEVLRWYAESTTTEFLPVNSGTPNFYGVRNLHGLIWEWVADFNSALIGEDSSGGGLDTRLFCGAGAQNAQNVDDYPAFMRYAFRSSLKADYCIHNLGFRCAKDL